jgi:hypothetical protein
MNAYSDRSRWWFFVFAALAAVAVGFLAYNAGVSRGAAAALASGAAQAPGAVQGPGAPYP